MHKAFWAIVICGVGTASWCSAAAAVRPRPVHGPTHRRALDIRKQLLESSDAAGATDAATEATGTGWGNARGNFKYVGTPPTPGKLSVDKDPEVCGKGGGIADNSLLVGSDGGIANIVLYARAKRVHESAQPLPAN